MEGDAGADVNKGEKGHNDEANAERVEGDRECTVDLLGVRLHQKQPLSQPTLDRESENGSPLSLANANN